MGFSGVTGSSDRAMSALMHYGLARKAGKGELQLTDTAVDILHPDSDSGRRYALREAGFSPALFQEMRKKFPNQLPSEETINTHLIRQGFAQRAVGPAGRAYMETCRFLQQEGAYESEGADPLNDLESSEDMSHAEDKNMYTPDSERAPPPKVEAPQPPPSGVGLNDIRLEIDGSTGSVTARFDRQGLARLIKKLERLQGVMDDDDDPSALD